MQLISNSDVATIESDKVNAAIEIIVDKSRLSIPNQQTVLFTIRRLEQQAQMLLCHLHHAVFRLALLEETDEVQDFFASADDAKADFDHAMDIFGEVFGQRPPTVGHMFELLKKYDPPVSQPLATSNA